MDRLHAFGDDALGDHDAVGLVLLLRSRQVSVPEVVDAAIGRAERMQPRLAGLAHAAYGRARADSRSPQGGYFAGIPTVVKDNVDVVGMPTQHGTTSYVAKPAGSDGDVARLLLATGAIVLGKSRLSEFGFNAVAEPPGGPPVRNPWDPAYTAGGSSAGAAALVAAGAVPFAHANDGGGSIRIPAACCGLVGLKPTRGRLPSDRMSRSMPVRTVVDGMLSRSVRDTAAFFREAEKIYRDLKLPPVGDVHRPNRRRLKIGVVTDAVGALRTDRETRAAVLATATLLEDLGHRVDVIDTPVPESFVGDFSLYWAMLAWSVVSTGRASFGRTFDKDAVDDLTRGLHDRCVRGLPRLPLAVARLRAMSVASARFYRSYDVVLSPTLGHTTPEIGHLSPAQDFEQVFGRLLEWVRFTPPHNASGEPAISLPLGRTDSGLPLGMQFAAAAGRECTLLELAYELEEAHPWARIQDLSPPASEQPSPEQP